MYKLITYFYWYILREGHFSTRNIFYISVIQLYLFITAKYKQLCHYFHIITRMILLEVKQTSLSDAKVIIFVNIFYSLNSGRFHATFIPLVGDNPSFVWYKNTLLIMRNYLHSFNVLRCTFSTTITLKLNKLSIF